MTRQRLTWTAMGCRKSFLVGVAASLKYGLRERVPPCHDFDVHVIGDVVYRDMFQSSIAGIVQADYRCPLDVQRV